MRNSKFQCGLRYVNHHLAFSPVSVQQPNQMHPNPIFTHMIRTVNTSCQPLLFHVRKLVDITHQNLNLNTVFLFPSTQLHFAEHNNKPPLALMLSNINQSSRHLFILPIFTNLLHFARSHWRIFEPHEDDVMAEMLPTMTPSSKRVKYVPPPNL